MAVTDARVVVVERWSVLRRGLVGVLDGSCTIVDELEDTGDLGRVLSSRPVDLVIVGDELGLDLVAVLKNLDHADLRVPVLVLSDDVDVELLRGALRAGAQAVLSKKVDDDTLLDSIQRVLRGDRVIDQRYLPLLYGVTDLEDADDQRADDLLTPRERDVLRLLAQGATNRQIAESLLVGEATVKTHLGRIYSKLDVAGRHHAVGRALELGILG